MSMLLSRMVAFAFAVVLLGTAATASARPKKPSPEPTSTAITMCDGTPIIMVGIECKKRASGGPAGGEEEATKPTVCPGTSHAAIAGAAATVDGRLHSAPRQQPQCSDQPT